MDRIKKFAFNGMCDRDLLNAHLSYRGKSIIVDYEHVLHCYSMYEDSNPGCVLVEVYPYQDDIDLFYVKLDERFNKADIGEIFEHINAYDETEFVTDKND